MSNIIEEFVFLLRIVMSFFYMPHSLRAPPCAILAPMTMCPLCQRERPDGSMLSSTDVLYALARILGDVSAIKRGRIGQRIARRVVGGVSGRGIGRSFR